MGVSDQHHALAVLYPWYPLVFHRALVGGVQIQKFEEHSFASTRNQTPGVCEKMLISVISPQRCSCTSVECVYFSVTVASMQILTLAIA
jgi:hypothetical protein